MFNFLKKNNLDEMQEQRLLRVERNGCWLAFWGLFAVLQIQFLLEPENMVESMMGEWIVFMCLAIYLVIGSVRAGVWDRRLKANGKTNFLCSLLAGVIFSIPAAVGNYTNYGDLFTAILTFVLGVFFITTICFAALSFAMMLYKKRVRKMDAELEE